MPVLKNDKHEIFCHEYLVDLNATQACIRAGFAGKYANRQAYALMARDDVKKRIEELMKRRRKRIDIAEEDILAELAAIAFANASDFATVDIGEGLDKAGNPVEVKRVNIKSTEDIDQSKLPALAGIKMSTSGIEIKAYDKMKALELLMRHLGMMKDKPEHSGDVNITVDLKGEIEEWGK
jgi:phage terminase small subunit